MDKQETLFEFSPDWQQSGAISGSMADPDEDYADYGDGNDVCDGCGEPYGMGQCPICCGNVFSPGSEECDWCEYSAECG